MTDHGQHIELRAWGDDAVRVMATPLGAVKPPEEYPSALLPTPLGSSDDANTRSDEVNGRNHMHRTQIALIFLHVIEIAVAKLLIKHALIWPPHKVNSTHSSMLDKQTVACTHTHTHTHTRTRTQNCTVLPSPPATLVAGNMRASVDTDGILSFTRVSDGKTLLKESSPRVFAPSASPGYYTVDLTFAGSKEER